MSKRITTRWYIGAWVVWILALIAMVVIGRGAQGATSPPAGVVIAYGVAFVSAIVMLVMWIGALVKLGMQHSWGWFAAVLILQLVMLGIIGTLLYAIAGPEDTEVVMRPTAT
jgi:hypothetical protein